MADITLEYLEKERKLLWEKITDLEKEIKTKTPEIVSETKQASKMCTQYKNRAEKTMNDAIDCFNSVQSSVSYINESDVTTKIDEILSFASDMVTQKNNIDANLATLNGHFTNHSEYQNKLEKLEQISNDAEEAETQIEANAKLLRERKKEIDSIYYEIFGTTNVNEDTGEIDKVTGRKELLDNAYKELESNLKRLEEERKKAFDNIVEEWSAQYDSSKNEIESLLPRALTTGLSSAYSHKKDIEEKERTELNGRFRSWILLLIIISIIPFATATYLILEENKTLLEVIKTLPSMVYPLILLYMPPLWMALSLNKKINLSKRLIEEYTHKEVVAKTYEGLAKQIENLEDKKESENLRKLLLKNILDISSNNPGVLISDYNKTDHPVLEKLTTLVKRDRETTSD